MMRFTANGIRIGASLAVIIILMSGIKGMSNYLFSIHRYSFSVDPLLSKQARGAIQDFIQSHTSSKNNTISWRLFFEQLQTHFPYIRSVSAELIAPGVLHCTLKAYKPLVVFNTGCVMADSGIVVGHGVFADYKIKNIHKIIATKNPQINTRASASLLRAVERISPALSAGYTISWVNEFEVWLHDKNKEPFSIMCSADSIPDFNMINYCEMLKKEVAQQGTTNRVRKHWIADVRFNKQIILFSKKGGMGYG